MERVDFIHRNLSFRKRNVRERKGNVGIGTTGPAHLLTISGSANTNVVNVTAASGQTNVTMMRADGTAVTCGIDNTNAWSCTPA